jgi:hypothetical protein
MDTDEDWQTILSYLPEGWEEDAFRCGALTRLRGFDSPEALLRVLLIHFAYGCSLRETAVRAARGGIASVSDVAILKRLRSSEHWLRKLCLGLRENGDPAQRVLEGSGFRFVAVDATCISEPGSTGTNWKLHYALEIPSLSCTHFTLTDPSEGEKFSRFSFGEGDLVLADRAYGNITGIQSVLSKKAQVLVRMKISQKGFYRPGEQTPFDFLGAAESLREGERIEWDVSIRNGKGQEVGGRLCLLRRSEEVAELARRKILAEARKKKQKVRDRTLSAASFFGLFSTVPRKDLSLDVLFEAYRFRWQIELAFKRLKSVVSLGHLPKRDPASCRAWLYGKLLVGLLVDKMARTPFFP